MQIGAAALCAAVSFADIQSSNIVGFSNKTARQGDLHQTLGTCFLSINSKTPGMFRIGDMKLNGATYCVDWLNFIDPSSAVIDTSKNITYYSEAESIIDFGTPDYADWENTSYQPVDDTELPFGTGFLCSFVSEGVTLEYAGQVNQDEVYSTIDCTGKPFAFVNNIYPGDITLGQMKLEGSVYCVDWLNFVDATSAVVDTTRNVTYYSEAESIIDFGTPDYSDWENTSYQPVDELPIKMGEGFLCSFVSPAVKIVFPTFSAK